MSIFAHLAALALQPLVQAACRRVDGPAAKGLPETAANYLRQCFSDHGQKIYDALRRAAIQTWSALEVAVAGERLRALVNRDDDQVLRELLRRFFDALAAEGLFTPRNDFQAETLGELRAARAAGLLAGASLNPTEIAKTTASPQRLQDPAEDLRAEWRAIDRLADQIRMAGYGSLARFLSLRPLKGRSFLAVSLRYFFRREIERVPELSQSLAIAEMEPGIGLTDAGFDALSEALTNHTEPLEQRLEDLARYAGQPQSLVLDLRVELPRAGEQLQSLGSAVLQALKTYQLEARLLRASDSLMIGEAVDLRRVRELASRYGAVPETHRIQLPALLFAIGKLELIAGDVAGASQHFRRLAALVPESSARAEAQYARFLAACEQQLWDEALEALIQAASLDRKRFAPFPLSRYKPQRILGAGGSGIAILCRGRYSGTQIVIKLLRTDCLERPVPELFREAGLLEDLDCPAIIRIRQCDFADADHIRPYIVMDHFDGPTLDVHIRQNGPMNLENWIPVAVSLGEALHAAHSRGVIHRDVKPTNILLRRESERALALGAGSPWQVRLIDFGLALRPNIIRAGLTRVAGTTAGSLRASVARTLEYSSPEQLGRLHNVTVGPAADIYGFGKTCCYALFQTTQPLRKHWRMVPDRFADLLEHCLAENPSDRPMNFGEVLDELGSVARTPHSEPVQLSTGSDGHRKIWSETPVALAPAERTLHGHVGAVLCLDVSADGSRILSGGEDHTVRLWDLASGREVRCLPGHRNAVCSLAFTPDGARAVSSSTDQTVRIWELESGVTVHSFDRQTNRSVAISADGRLALTGSLHDGIVRLWELGTGKEIRRLRGHTDWVHCVTFSWDGRRILSGGMDRTIRVWDALTGRQLKCMPLQTGRIIDLAISRAGEQAVSGGDDRLVRFWDLKTGRELARLTGHTDSVLSVAISPDGRAAVSAGQDRTIRLWDLVAGREMRRYEGHQGPVLAVRFTPDGKHVVSGGSDGTIRVWRTIVA